MTVTLSPNNPATRNEKSSESPLFECRKLEKIYPSQKSDVVALQSLDLTIEPGEFLSIKGPSGRGKTTLLMILGGMSHPTSGQALFNGQDIYSMSTRDRAKFRARSIGFVFQMFHLAPYLNILENTLLAYHPKWKNASDPQPPTDRAREILDSLGLSHRLTHLPSALSAGERQRAAIARAFFNRPSVILADEPTGNLDPENGRRVFQALHTFHQNGGAVALVTHGEMGSEYATREIQLN
jgi:putative ABC transport system ATP-binding protein